MTGAIRRFRIRLIPITLLWSLASCQLIVSVYLIGSCVTAIAEPTPTSDLQSSWPPLLAAAGIAWLAPTGADAFAAGWFFYRGRWKAAAYATAALLLLGYLCLIPMFLVLANYPGPS
jgi:hypothetical protein